MAFVGAAGLAVAAPACLAAVPIALVLRRRRALLLLAALVGAAATLARYPDLADDLSRVVDALTTNDGDRADVASAVWPQLRELWLSTAPLAPTIALLVEGFRPKQVAELHRERHAAARRGRARRERRALGTEAPAPPSSRSRVLLGRHLDGDPLLPVGRRGKVHLSADRLRKLTLAVGAPGSGKTETLLRLACGTAGLADWTVFMLDPKGDATTMRRFAALMERAGRTPALFPDQAYDGWRGSPAHVANRLIEMIDWPEEGGGTYYRDLSVNLVRLACTAPDGAPGSADELLGRLDRDRLADLWAGTNQAQRLLDFKEADVAACRHRYQAFFDAVGGQLDGAFAFEDADCGYLLLDELAFGDETGKLARFLFADFKQYVATRKARGRNVLLIVDEFSAVASGDRIARLVEVVRSHGGSLVLAPQAYEGMGDPAAAARILSAAHTTLLHHLPTPEPFVQAAGTEMAIEASIQHDRGRSLDVGTTREQHQHKVDPNAVRTLTPGMCFVIGSGQAQRIQVAATPSGK